MRILVIGGSGFIGQRLISELSGRGHDVGVYDLVVAPHLADRTIQGDVRDQKALEAACLGHEVVVNLAAAHRDDVRPVSLYYEVNADGAQRTVEAAAAAGVRRIVFTSSVAVYGLDKADSKESDPVEPFNDYGRSKIAAEAHYRAWQNQDSARSLVIVRPCVVFGEGNRGNVYTLAKQVSTGWFVTVGDGRNRKSMAYVGNVAAYLADRVEADRGPALVNYADKPDLMTNELVRTLRAALDKHTGQSLHIPLWLGVLGGRVFDVLARLIRRPLPISAVRVQKFAASTVVNTDRLEASGFERPFTIVEGLRRTVRAEFGVSL
jgi:nucleoside-diphosphate-sugar epimerase